MVLSGLLMSSLAHHIYKVLSAGAEFSELDVIDQLVFQIGRLGFDDTADLKRNTIYSVDNSYTASNNQDGSISYETANHTPILGTSSINLSTVINISCLQNYPISLTFWILPTDLTSNRCLFSLTPNGFPMFQLTSTGAIECYETSGSLKFSTSSDIVIGDWNHICVTFDATNDVNVYVNSVFSGSGTLASQFSQTFTFGISSIINSSLVFTGYADSIRIYAKALTHQEVYDLVAYESVYNMVNQIGQHYTPEVSLLTTNDEFQIGTSLLRIYDGTNYSDISGLSNLPTITEYYKLGNKSLNFNSDIASKDRSIEVSSGTGSDFDLTNMTLSGWFWIDSNMASWRILYSFEVSAAVTPYTIHIYLYRANTSSAFEIRILHSQGTTAFSEVASSIVSDQWCHIAFSFEQGNTGCKASVYANGETIGESLDMDISTTITKFYIGSDNSTFEYDSYIDSFQLYRRSLSQLELKYLYLKQDNSIDSYNLDNRIQTPLQIDTSFFTGSGVQLVNGDYTYTTSQSSNTGEQVQEMFGSGTYKATATEAFVLYQLERVETIGGMEIQLTGTNAPDSVTIYHYNDAKRLIFTVTPELIYNSSNLYTIFKYSNSVTGVKYIKFEFTSVSGNIELARLKIYKGPTGTVGDIYVSPLQQSVNFRSLSNFQGSADAISAEATIPSLNMNSSTFGFWFMVTNGFDSDFSQDVIKMEPLKISYKNKKFYIGFSDIVTDNVSGNDIITKNNEWFHILVQITNGLVVMYLNTVEYASFEYEGSRILELLTNNDSSYRHTAPAGTNTQNNTTMVDPGSGPLNGMTQYSDLSPTNPYGMVVYISNPYNATSWGKLTNIIDTYVSENYTGTWIYFNSSGTCDMVFEFSSVMAFRSVIITNRDYYAYNPLIGAISYWNGDSYVNVSSTDIFPYQIPAGGNQSYTFRFESATSRYLKITYQKYTGSTQNVIGEVQIKGYSLNITRNLVSDNSSVEYPGQYTMSSYNGTGMLSSINYSVALSNGDVLYSSHNDAETPVVNVMDTNGTAFSVNDGNNSTNLNSTSVILIYEFSNKISELNEVKALTPSIIENGYSWKSCSVHTATNVDTTWTYQGILSGQHRNDANSIGNLDILTNNTDIKYVMYTFEDEDSQDTTIGIGEIMLYGNNGFTYVALYGINHTGDGYNKWISGLEITLQDDTIINHTNFNTYLDTTGHRLLFNNTNTEYDISTYFDNIDTTGGNFGANPSRPQFLFSLKFKNPVVIKSYRYFKYSLGSTQGWFWTETALYGTNTDISSMTASAANDINNYEYIIDGILVT